MSVVFPFGFPAATAFYLTLYVLTFVFHHVFMHYVLAGSLYVAWAAVWPGHGPVPRSEQPLAATLRDWMPFLLSAAITAGVAPLLFIQIAYQQQFYSANLLLWWRWMLVVPVLIVAFYLLYLLKSSMLWRWPYAARAAIAITTSMSFVFVGLCWTVNHLLANSEATWPEVYASGHFPFSPMTVVTRMMIWIGGSFATMSAIVGWQLYYRQSLPRDLAKQIEDPVAREEHSVRILAALACGGLVVASIAGVYYLGQCDLNTRNVVFGGMIQPYLWMIVVGVVMQGIGWTLQWRSDSFGVAGLTTVSTGTLFGLLGVSVVREGIRVTSIDLGKLAERHCDATAVGGFGVFLGATVLVVLMMVWCVRLVQTGQKEI